MPITRRNFLVSSSMACVAAALGAGRPVRAGEGLEPLRGNVGRFTGRGGTIGWLMTPEALVVVDSQFPDTAKTCLEGLRARSARRIDVLINTHHHGDHTSGNGVFRPETEHIVAHERVPALQKTAWGGREDQPEPTVADTTFEETWKLDLGAETITARHFGPAHTGGDCVVHFEQANVVHMGDLVFQRWHPFIDRDGGASVGGWAYALYQVIEAFPEDTLFVFGHGERVTGTREDLAEQRNYLLAVMDAARKGVRAGQSLEEVQSRETLPGFEAYASPGPRLTLAASLKVAYEEIRATERGRGSTP